MGLVESANSGIRFIDVLQRSIEETAVFTYVSVTRILSSNDTQKTKRAVRYSPNDN